MTDPSTPGSASVPLPAQPLPAQRTVRVGDLSFGLLESGPIDGPLALCLHGYPDTAWTWRHLLPALARAGWHAVAPFTRGYAPSDVPADGQYQVAALAADANALHEALGGGEDAVLIGHDWGASTAYAAGSHEPDRWRRLVTLAVPPASVLAAGFTSVEQLKRSWYMFFQLTALAEYVVPSDGFAFLRRLWRDWSPGYDPSEDLAHVAEALAEPANLLAALGYYRAQFGMIAQDPALAEGQAAIARTPPQPTLFLHGRDDGCLGVEVASCEGAILEHLSAGSRFEAIEGAGHFLQLERPAEVNGLVLDFIASGTT